MKKTVEFPAPGKMAIISGHKMHVFVSGQGAKTYVFMAGSGTSCPALDFKPLWSILSENNRIAVVEKAGYGWSEATRNPRDLPAMLGETRETLSRVGLKPPYILVPHSMSGLEAIYWAQVYPGEVKAICGLDPAVPDFYDIMKISFTITLGMIGILVRLGIHKPFASGICKKLPAVSSGCLDKEEIEAYREIFCRSTFTSDMLNEAKYVKQNAQIVKSNPIPDDLPVYFFCV